MDRSYSIARASTSQPAPKRQRRAYRIPIPVDTDFIYTCIKCDAPVSISNVILCTCGSRVVRKQKTKKEQIFLCR